MAKRVTELFCGFNWPMAIVVTCLFVISEQQTCARRAERRAMKQDLENIGVTIDAAIRAEKKRR